MLNSMEVFVEANQGTTMFHNTMYQVDILNLDKEEYIKYLIKLILLIDVYV